MPEFVPSFTPCNLDDFTQGYMEAMEFTECHADNPDMRDADGFSPDCIAKAKTDCADFMATYETDLAIYEETTQRPMTHAGHDFWLTRNHNGTGFWDRISQGESAEGYYACERLSDAAKSYGEVYLYVSDDNLIEQQ